MPDRSPIIALYFLGQLSQLSLICRDESALEREAIFVALIQEEVADASDRETKRLGQVRLQMRCLFSPLQKTKRSCFGLIQLNLTFDLNFLVFFERNIL